jgi:hypothetical protein
MKKLSVAILICALALALAMLSGLPQATASPKAEDDFQLVQVADGIYAAIAKSGGLASGNAGFMIGDDGVVIFDTFFTPAAIEELIGEIEMLSY